MSNDFSIKTEIIPASVAYGVVLQIEGLDKFRAHMKSVKAQRKVDVCVTIDGMCREFTIDEFKKCLDL